MKEFSEVNGGLIVQALVSKQKGLKDDSLFDWQPVQLLNQRRSVLTSACPENETCRAVLDLLKLLYVFGSDVNKQRVAVVQSGCY